jgi:CRP-like cAMP-binding protein
LPLGSTVHGAGDRQQYLHFLTEGVVSRLSVTRNGASAEFALTGSEGVVGVASFLGGESMPSEAVVLSAGYGYRLSANVLAGEFGHDGLLPRLLLRYTQALITQAGQIAACNRLHAVEQQLCRWILSFLDRSPADEFLMTQEVIADLLGVRRESVTEAAGKLQEAGLIHYSRGHIAVLDRPRLEAQVCECYAVVKREYERLLAGNTSSTTPACAAHVVRTVPIREDLARAEVT